MSSKVSGRVWSEHTLEQLKGKMLTNKEATKVKQRRGKNSSARGLNSYKVHVQGKQWLYMLSPGHTYDPEHPGIAKVVSATQEFFLKAEPPRTIFTEGGLSGYGKNLEDSVRKHGEGGAVLFTSKSEDFRHESPEPNEKDETSHLLKKHGFKQTMAYYLIRQHDQWARGDRRNHPDFESYIQKYAERYRKLLPSGLHDKPFSYSEVLELCALATNNQFNLEDRVASNQASDPFFNSVAASSVDFRDYHIISRILIAVQNGESVLAVYGSHHAIRLQPALESLACGGNTHGKI